MGQPQRRVPRFSLREPLQICSFPTLHPEAECSPSESPPERPLATECLTPDQCHEALQQKPTAVIEPRIN